MPVGLVSYGDSSSSEDEETSSVYDSGTNSKPLSNGLASSIPGAGMPVASKDDHHDMVPPVVAAPQISLERLPAPHMASQLRGLTVGIKPDDDKLEDMVLPKAWEKLEAPKKPSANANLTSALPLTKRPGPVKIVLPDLADDSGSNSEEEMDDGGGGSKRKCRKREQTDSSDRNRLLASLPAPEQTLSKSKLLLPPSLLRRKKPDISKASKTPSSNLIVSDDMPKKPASITSSVRQNNVLPASIITQEDSDEEFDTTATSDEKPSMDFFSLDDTNDSIVPCDPWEPSSSSQSSYTPSVAVTEASFSGPEMSTFHNTNASTMLVSDYPDNQATNPELGSDSEVKEAHDSDYGAILTPSTSGSTRNDPFAGLPKDFVNRLKSDEAAMAEFLASGGLQEVNANHILGNVQETLLRNLSDSMMTNELMRKAKSGVQATSSQRQKHQLPYLAQVAKEREAELQLEWSKNRNTRRQTQSKYGFL